MIFQVAESGITGRADESANHAGFMAMVHVKPVLRYVPAQKAFAPLRGQCLVVPFQRASVFLSVILFPTYFFPTFWV